jgi:hypothetical protein
MYLGKIEVRHFYMDAVLPNTSELCTYTLIGNDVHCFTFHSKSHDTVDAWYQAIRTVMQQSGTDQSKVLKLLYDGRTIGNLPFGPIIQRSKDLVAAYPDRPPTRSAIVTKKLPAITTTINVLMPIVRLISRQADETRFFWHDEWDKAIAWLDNAK